MKDLDDPTNRDSVPAMLTPGEFVLNKEAVQMYGPVIEQMNNHGLAARANGNAKVMGYNVGGLVSFLKDEEGWRDEAYKDSGGVWTIGYGRTFNDDGTPVKKGQKTTRKDENSWLEKRAKEDYDATKSYLDKHGYDYTDGQLQSLASFRYNGGQGMLEMLTDNGTRDWNTIYTKMPEYNKVKQDGKYVAIDGLTNRRNAELGLWGDNWSQPAQTTAAVEQSQSDDTIDVSPVAEAAEHLLMPDQPQMEVPNLMQPMQAPDYIPSVTYRKKQSPGHFNIGGLIKSFFNSDDDDEEEKKKEVEQLRRMYREMNAIEEGAEYDPRGANQVPTPDWQMSPEGQSVKNLQDARAGNLPTIPQIPVEPEIGGFDQRAPELNNRIQMIHNIPQMPVPPTVESVPPTPPAPMVPPSVTPDAVVNEQLTAKQQWDRLKSERDALPEGHPRRVELSNRMNQINVANAAVDPRAGITGAANATGIPVPPKVYSGRGEEGYYDEEERKYRLNEQLRQKQMQQAVTSPDAPGKAMVDAQVDALQEQLTSLGVPPESQGVGVEMRVPKPGERPNIGTPQRPGYDPKDMTAVPGIDAAAPDVAQQTADEEAPDLNDPRKESTEMRKPQSLLKTNPAEAGKIAKDAIEKHGEQPSQELLDKPVQEVADAGAQAIAKDPGLFKNVAGSLKSAFGDLFDSRELARMAVVFAGAMLTGASAGQALAYAGGMYMQRVDARAAQFDKLVLSGEYTPESLKVYKESQDLTDLVPVTEKPVVTGKFHTMYTKSGQAVVVQEAKVGDNTVLIDEKGRQVNGYALQNQSPEDRQSYIKEHRGNVESQLEEMRETFDVQEDFSKTDILPSTNAGKIVEWAVDNGVDPAELGGLVESAYHDALNDNRQDGSRARNLVPYLNQLIIRQQIPNGSELFTVKPADADGPAQYVNPAKLQKMNLVIGNKLKKLGHKGGTQDLANIFYTEAAKDWNALPEAVRKQWNKRSTDDVNGFYLFVEDMIINS